MVQSEAQTRAKAKYYAKLKKTHNTGMTRREDRKNIIINKEKHLDTVKKILSSL
jgi:hypothetical protein